LAASPFFLFVAVKTTCWPKTDEPTGAAVTVVLVGAGLTVWVREPLLLVNVLLAL
jgi:hypothetical protein